MKYLLCLFFSASLFAASGGITEGEQYIKGKKVFDDNAPTSTTLSGNATLSKASHAIQLMDPNGSNRNITLPDVAASKGYIFRIVNTGSGADLVVKNAAASTIATISQNQSGYVASDGVTWSGWVSASSFSGGLAAAGTTTGATSQAQTFTNGVVLDAITGNTATALAIAAKVGSSAIGNAITLAAGAGNGAFNGGAASLTGGASGAGATGAGGAASLTGGAAASTNGAGGAVTVTGGAGVGTGVGGVVTLTPGASGASAGATAAAITGTAAAGLNGQTGGGVTWTGGAGQGVGNGGNVTLTPGAAGGSGVVGKISLAGPVSSPVTAAQTLANGNTVTLPTSGFNKLVTNAGAVTGILMTAGAFDGQVVVLINNTANSITFAAVGTSLVADGVSAVIAANTRMTLVYDATSLKWYHGN